MHNGSFKSSALVVALGIASALTTTAETIAYYRFETSASGQPFGPATERGILDSSPSGFHASPQGGPLALSDVPMPAIPLTGESNTRSIHFTGKEYVGSTLDQGLSQVAFKDFTVELWARFESLKGWQTLVGRDDTGNPGEGVGQTALFYISKSKENGIPTDQTRNGLRVELITHNNQMLSFNSSLIVVTGKWYHIAVVGDVSAGTLTLFVDRVEVGGTTGYTGMFVPPSKTQWTLGRGQYEGKGMDFFIGSMDEVRFSDVALSPALFLCTPEVRPPSRPKP